MSYQCLIIEDEPIAQDIIKEYLTHVPSLELAATSENAFEATEVLQQQKIDLIFLDIHLPQLSGLNFIKTLPHPPKVIITTAYQEYALEGFELSVCDYLLKPFSMERFLKAVNKAIYELDLEQQQATPKNEGSGSTIGAQKDFLFVKTEDKTWKVPINEILYLEAYGNYVKIHTPSKTYLSSKNLQYFAEALKDQAFIRIHRSYLVPFSSIEALEGNQVLIGQEKLPVGQQYKHELMRWMQA